MQHVTLNTDVNSARPSSGCRGCFLLSAATTTGLRPGVALPPASPLSRVCPRWRGGSPSGDLSAPPALSLRGCGPQTLNWSPSVGMMREVPFPSLVTPVADEGECTHAILLTLSTWSMRFVPTAFRPSDVARGFVWDPLIPGRYLNSMFPADTWSTGVSRKLTRNPERGRYTTLYPTTPDFRRLTTYCRLYYDFNRSISPLISSQTHWSLSKNSANA